MTLDPKTQRLGEERIGKLLWSFSLPAITGMVVGSLYTIVDRAFLGNVVGADAIAGVSLCMPIAFVMMAFGMLVGVGSAALVSIRLGQQNKQDAEVILGNALTMIIVLSIVLTALFLRWLEPLLIAFGASESTLPYAKQFMHVILFGSFFQYASFGLNAVIRAEGNPRLAMFTMLINAGINIVLDAVFVLALGYGVTGAAVATVFAQGVSASWTLSHFLSNRSVLKLRARNLRPRWQVIRPALAIGLAPFSMQLAASVINLLVNRALARHGGDLAISAYGVIASLAMLVMMPVFGIIQGSQPIIGYNFGAGRLDRVRATLRLAILAATAVVCVGFVVAEAIPSELIRVFVPDERLIALGARGMRIGLMMLPVVGFQVVASSFFQAIGKARIAIGLSLLRQVVVFIPLLLLLPRFWGLDGVWSVGPIADSVASVITAAALVYQLREHKRQGNRVQAPATLEPIVGEAIG